jgi:hypothetical protein
MPYSDHARAAVDFGEDTAASLFRQPHNLKDFSMESLRNPTTIVCFVMCLITFFSTVLIASHAQGSNIIYGCTKKVNGQLRVVSGPGQCNPGENEISWINGQGGDLGSHYKEYKFSLADGESYSFPVPKTDAPVRVEASVLNVVVDKRDGTTENYPASMFNFLATYNSSFHLWNGEAVNTAPGGVGTSVITIKAEETTDNIIASWSRNDNDPGTPVIQSDHLDFVVHLWY